jgi:hypothetical protein
MVEIIKSLFESVGGLVSIMDSLFKLLNGNWKGAWKNFGDGIMQLIGGAGLANTNTKALGDINKQVGSKEFVEILKMMAASGSSIRDAIITKEGKLIHTDPQDNLIATKSLDLNGVYGKKSNESNKGGNYSIVNHVYLTVSEGNARNAGNNFIDGIEQGLKNKIQNGLLLEGAR